MAIISVLNPKGGSGKTTLSTNLARSLHERGRKVLIVDSDPQGSARDWHAATEDNPLPLVALDRPNNVKNLSGIAASYDYVVIDGAAKLEDMMAAAIKVSDCVLIPVQPSPYDLWAASDLVEFVKARQEVTDGKPRAAFVISRAIRGTKLGHEIGKALNEYGLSVFNTPIMQRQIYPQTAADGLTVFDGTNADAIVEIKTLTDEFLAFMTARIKEAVHDGVNSKTA
jgi:chromosome partitioning protein